MKTTVIYLHVTKSGYPSAPPPEYYFPFSKRWVDTYLDFPGEAEHDLRIICCGKEPDDSVVELYSNVNHSFDVYTGAGSDIGACQWAMRRVDADFVVCMSTPVYFWRSGWLAKLVAARKFFGDGLYGPMASHQNRPHIRTSCWCVDPKTFAKYPHLIDTREKCAWAESFDHNGEGWQISDWYSRRGMSAMMVTWRETCARGEWRKPANIFRRGDQSNCLVWDQHVDVYKCAHYHERLALEKMADEDLTALS